MCALEWVRTSDAGNIADMPALVEPLLKLLMFACLVTTGLAWWKSEALPPPTTWADNWPRPKINAPPKEATRKSFVLTVRMEGPSY